MDSDEELKEFQTMVHEMGKNGDIFNAFKSYCESVQKKCTQINAVNDSALVLRKQLDLDRPGYTYAPDYRDRDKSVCNDILEILRSIQEVTSQTINSVMMYASTEKGDEDGQERS